MRVSKGARKSKRFSVGGKESSAVTEKAFRAEFQDRTENKLHETHYSSDHQPSFGLRVQDRLAATFDSAKATECLVGATDGDLYVIGGTIRRALLSDQRSGDLDFMVPNGDNRAFVVLDSLRLPWKENSQGHRRYRWNTLQLDIFSPKEFYRGFESVEKALSFFDLKINAIALHLKSNAICNPLNVSLQETPTNPGVNWDRWLDSAMTDVDITILAIRLVRIMFETRTLSLCEVDAQRFESYIIPRIARVNWNLVSDRFPLGQEAFLRELKSLISRREQPLVRPSEKRSIPQHRS